MAITRWTGMADAVAQVDTFTPANVEIGDIFTLTVTGADGTSHAVNYTATEATVSNVTAGLTAAWNNDADPLCTPITAADNTTNLTLTADTAGDAFSVASSTTDGGGTDDQTLTRAATTANDGPKVWDSSDNWSNGVPGSAANQDVYVENWSGDILYGLDQSGAANTITSLHIADTFTGKIGVNEAAGFSVGYLEIKAVNIYIGEQLGSSSGAGSGRIKIDNGTTAVSIFVHRTAAASDPGKSACRLKANQASSGIYVDKGDVSILPNSDESGTLFSVLLGHRGSPTSDATVYIGAGATVTNLTLYAGTVYLAASAAITTGTMYGGTLYWQKGSFTTLNQYTGSNIIGLSSLNGTIVGTWNHYGGSVDFSRLTQAIVITTYKYDPGASITYIDDLVTLTNDMVALTTVGERTVTVS